MGLFINAMMYHLVYTYSDSCHVPKGNHQRSLYIDCFSWKDHFQPESRGLKAIVTPFALESHLSWCDKQLEQFQWQPDLAY